MLIELSLKTKKKKEDVIPSFLCIIKSQKKNYSASLYFEKSSKQGALSVREEDPIR